MVDDNALSVSEPEPWLLLVDMTDGQGPGGGKLDELATFCDDELLVSVLNAFIHLVFMPAPLPPLPLPPVKLNLLPRWLSCCKD